MATIYGANTLSTGYDVANSLRFDDGSSDYLNRTPGSAGNRKTFTISLWIKRANLVDSRLISCYSANSDTGNFELDFNNDTFRYVAWDTNFRVTNRLFRDTSAWYHIVTAVDTTDSTAGDRIKIYVNGVQETSFSSSSNPSQNFDTGFNQASTTRIGIASNSTNGPFDGYMAEVVFIDGQALAPTSFGEFDSNSPTIWKPKDVSGLTFGTNGFYLEFKQSGTSQNSSGLGADTSGNDNHFAVTNVTATDVTTDTPTNNFCTIDSSYADDGNNLVQADFSEGNTKMVSTVDGWKFGRGTFLLEAGKWYVEVKATEQGSGENGRFGLQPAQGGEALGNTDDNDTFEGINVGFAGSDTDLQKLDTGSGSTLFSNFSSGSIAMLAFDLDNDKVWVGSNGTWSNGSATQSTTLDTNNHDFTLPTVDLGWVFGLGMTKNGSNNIAFEYNWGQPSFSISSGNSDADGHGNFEYAVPSGFFACCTKNLAEYG